MATSSGATVSRSHTETGLVGNRMVLTGAVLYLLEWVAIVTASLDAPLGATASATELHAAYAGHVQSYAWAAGWFSVVLLGRILIMTGLRTALARSGRPQPLMDLAVVAMTVSVAIEIMVYALVAGASWSVGRGGSAAAIRTVDSVAYVVDETIIGALGVSLLCAGVAMWLSGLFPQVLSGLALLGGVFGVVDTAGFLSPEFGGLTDALSSGAAVPFWIWMLWTGAMLWRAAPSRQGSRLA